MFLMPPVVPQAQVTISSSLKASNISHNRRQRKQLCLEGTLPFSLPVYSAVREMLPRHTNKLIFIADGSSCL